MAANRRPMNPTVAWVLWLFVGLPLAVLITQWVCVFWLWAPQGLERLELLRDQEWARVHALGLQSPLPGAATLPAEVANGLYRTVYLDSGLDQQVRDLAGKHPSELGFGQKLDRTLFQIIGPALYAAMVGLQIFGLRLAMVVLFMPLFLLAVVGGGGDGWISRYLRRHRGERESGFLYHRFKRSIYFCLVAPISLYFLLPISLDPRLLFLPAAGVMGLTARMAVMWFKKYL